jgi:hypothetical protein
MNKYNLTYPELAHTLRTYEYELNQCFSFKDNAFDYDLDGFLESIQEDARTFDCIFDNDTIRVEGKEFCKFKLFYNDPRDYNDETNING